MGDTPAYLHRILQTINEMLEDRGYIVDPVEKNYTVDDFIEKYGQRPQRENIIRLCKSKADPTQICVYFTKLPAEGEGKQVTLKKCEEIYTSMVSGGITKAILVTKYGVSPYAQKQLDKLDDFTIETFRDEELLVNITQHRLVPPHILLTEEEKEELLDKYQIQPHHLPRIRRNDPVARYYGFRRNDVVKIIRPSETAGRYVTYRLVT
eukprot:TRINITY_DN3794_c0_g1_i3.p1 TRINITY_DN3794_c0_g1~~TRINITY_DN3794_c0_g1_i3.p1  ORF type:complete len:208 (+),score=39.65 TRINITY_DN3794_c0_g1_i3:700-1323(+)